jgi:hypothetical protein
MPMRTVPQCMHWQGGEVTAVALVLTVVLAGFASAKLRASSRNLTARQDLRHAAFHPDCPRALFRQREMPEEMCIRSWRRGKRGSFSLSGADVSDKSSPCGSLRQ